MNTLCIGYYLLISSIIYYLQLMNNNYRKYINFLYFYFILFVYNEFKNKLYLGDSGAYLLGFSFSIFLISIYNWNQHISPFL